MATGGGHFDMCVCRKVWDQEMECDRRLAKGQSDWVE